MVSCGEVMTGWSTEQEHSTIKHSISDSANINDKPSMFQRVKMLWFHQSAFFLSTSIKGLNAPLSHLPFHVFWACLQVSCKSYSKSNGKMGGTKSPSAFHKLQGPDCSLARGSVQSRC